MANASWRLSRWGALVVGAALAALHVAACESSSEDPGKTVTTDGGVPPPLSPICKGDTECKGQKCDPLKGCVDCVFDTDCGTKAHCFTGKCEPIVHCTVAKDCANGPKPVCDPLVKECVMCQVDTDCAKNQNVQEQPL